MAERHDEQLLGFATLDKIFPIIDTVDSLDSDVRVRPLAARQGKVLREMIEAIKTIKINIVEELPQTGSNDIIYFILNSNSTEDNNIYDEYVWIESESKYEKLGSFTTNIDLSQYLLKSGGEITGTIYSGSKTGLVNDSEDDLLTAVSKFINREEKYNAGSVTTYFTDTFQIIPEEGIAILKIRNDYEAYLSVYRKNQIQIGIITQSYSGGDRRFDGITIDKDEIIIGINNPLYGEAAEDFNGIFINKDGISSDANNPNTLFATDGSVTTLKTINGENIFGEGNIEINSEIGDVFPEGGEEGQVLTKISSGTAWQNIPTELPSGGTEGQVLKKTSSGVEWGTDEKGFELPSGGSDGQVLKKQGQTVVWDNDNDTTYQKATQQTDGLMSKEDKEKLDNISTAYATILTQEEYDSLNPKEENRVYYIKG